MKDKTRSEFVFFALQLKDKSRKGGEKKKKGKLGVKLHRSKKEKVKNEEIKTGVCSKMDPKRKRKKME
jgi:hypothetical protein